MSESQVSTINMESKFDIVMIIQQSDRKQRFT